ncbi:hypothetical protein BGW80DRAFT_790694 [Lactifluus volemus]|nr:hypothetical protein BGW80DRAFT_790694 [Lactifluus volemus]
MTGLTRGSIVTARWPTLQSSFLASRAGRTVSPFQTLGRLSIGSAYFRHHHDLLDMGGVDKELHLDASALHHVPEDEGRVGTASSDGDDHASKGGRCVCEIDGEHRARIDAIWMCSREEGADDLLFFCRRECFLEICHETLAIAKASPGYQREQRVL